MARRTVRRWWHWLREKNELFSFILRSRFPEWGRASVDLSIFWHSALTGMPLCEVMAWLDREITVP